MSPEDKKHLQRIKTLKVREDITKDFFDGKWKGYEYGANVSYYLMHKDWFSNQDILKSND